MSFTAPSWKVASDFPGSSPGHDVLITLSTLPGESVGLPASLRSARSASSLHYSYITFILLSLLLQIIPTVIYTTSHRNHTLCCFSFPQLYWKHIWQTFLRCKPWWFSRAQWCIPVILESVSVEEGRLLDVGVLGQPGQHNETSWKQNNSSTRNEITTIIKVTNSPFILHIYHFWGVGDKN